MTNLITVSARAAMILLAVLATIAAMGYAQIIAAPVALGVVVGLMVLSIERHIERVGLSPWVAAGVVVFAFLLFLMVVAVGFAVPLSALAARAPEIWKALQLQVSDWKGIFSSLNQVREQLGQMGGEVSHMKVTVDDGSSVATVVTLAPAYLAEVMLFLITIYFFLATQEDFRVAVLKLCVSRRMRWRVAHVFRDVEAMMSRYLISITIINIGLGCSVAACMWLIGVPTPVFWGMLAAFLNYVPYVGPAVVAVLLLALGLAIGDTPLGIVLPPAVYLGLNFLESQIVTTRVLGASMTVNPFLIFLSLAFWLWLWGPIGGFIAVPSLLIWAAILKNILPALTTPAPPGLRPVRYSPVGMDAVHEKISVQ